ncbi:MAG TPA: 30S ribosomal protein S1 [Terriglobales bacterium]|nr:30S ribosomal protein S1 [Terriglobales bacterium]
MSNPNIPEPDQNQSFDEILSQYEQSQARKGDKQIEGTVITVSNDLIILDIGYKSEGVLPVSALQSGETVKPGDKIPVTVKGRNPEGYYELTRFKVRLPTDWTALERAFAEKAAIVGMVTGVVKGGLTVDVGVRAFLPASRSGTRDAAELEKMVGQEIRCRITKLDVTDEDVVVDRRGVLEDEERAVKERRYSEVKEGDTVQGTVRSLADYGAFVDIGGVDGLLHVSDMSWARVKSPADVLAVGQQIEAVVLKIDREKKRISLGLKQLQAQPWDTAADKYQTGQRIKGVVTRVADFGAFVELEPGVEGLIHVSEMSWVKRVRTAGDVVKPGDTVEAVILGINPAERRISLGLKQALGDPWADAAQKFPVGAVVEGPVSSLAKFGAFVQVAEGVEGMVHIGDITDERRINHPQDVLKLGQQVKAQVLEIDTEKRRLRLGMKQLVPTSLDEYIAEHKVGDVVTGRVVDDSGDTARVELGEGIQASCRIPATTGAVSEQSRTEGKVDLSSLTSMLSARWKGNAPAPGPAKPEGLREGQIRSFKIAKLDPDAKQIEVELA